MGDLKPLGSEKLQGQEKIKRIIEISRYNETKPTSINETSKSEYGISLADGNDYQIVRERLGYIIKKTISESETDYIEPMKNRKYYSSYGQALKRLNLLTKEVNRLTENEEGTSLFGEQKKYTLKTPRPASPEQEPTMPPPPAEPPAVPTPELPASPESTPPSPEGGEDMGMPDMENLGGEDEGMPNIEDEEGGGGKEEEAVSFKMIQKLTGKLTQKMREFENEKGMTSENIKYVINMVLSAVDLATLSEEDKEDIMSKFEGGEDMGDMGGEDFGSEPEVDGDDMGGEEFGAEPEVEMGESLHGSIFDSIFGESKVDKVISKYFHITKEEKTRLQESKKEKQLINKSITKQKMKEVRKFTETIEQEFSSEKFLQENSNFIFVGKTNKNNLVFENKNTQIKISPEGSIL
jgi:hypothetical protein